MNTIGAATTCGRMMPHKVSTRFSESMSWNRGTMRIWPGIMIDAMIREISIVRPANRSRERA